MYKCQTGLNVPSKYVGRLQISWLSPRLSESWGFLSLPAALQAESHQDGSRLCHISCWSAGCPPFRLALVCSLSSEFFRGQSESFFVHHVSWIPRTVNQALWRVFTSLLQCTELVLQPGQHSRKRNDDACLLSSALGNWSRKWRIRKHVAQEASFAHLRSIIEITV